MVSDKTMNDLCGTETAMFQQREGRVVQPVGDSLLKLGCWACHASLAAVCVYISKVTLGDNYREKRVRVIVTLGDNYRERSEWELL